MESQLRIAGMFGSRGGTGLVVALGLAVLLPASFALAIPRHPEGEFKNFANCPLGHKKVTDCIHAVTEKGSFAIRGKTVAIRKPVIIQGGFEGSGDQIQFFGAEGAETVSRTPQPVPGGLADVTAPGWWPSWLQESFAESIKEGQQGVTATLELAAPATSITLSTEHLLYGEGTALGLPVKIKLGNPLLGPNCEIGSEKKPIQIDFTTGKSGTLNGTVGNPEANKKFTLTTITDGRFVNATFAAPRAHGCGGILSYFFDPLVDSILGTPSGAGHNTAILEGRFQDASASVVKGAIRP
jgi:hypothetical protein